MLKIKPQFVSKVWGGEKLNDVFGYKLPNNNIGECFAFSTLNDYQSMIISEPFLGQKLSDVFRNHPDLFGVSAIEGFPFLIKIIDAKDQLSIQVHPDDDYARKHEGMSNGKTESWVILDCGVNKHLVLGHQCQSKKEMKGLMKNGEWSKIIKHIVIENDQVINIPAGTLHAICANTMIYEIQQVSDLTYRFYDYGRGRPLHLKKSLEVLQIPHKSQQVRVKYHENYEVLVKNLYYSLYRITNKGSSTYKFSESFLCLTAIKGQGMVNGIKVVKGDHFIMTKDETILNVEGILTLLVASK